MQSWLVIHIGVIYWVSCTVSSLDSYILRFPVFLMVDHARLEMLKGEAHHLKLIKQVGKTKPDR
jgi:hypothetical protein